MAIYYSIFGRRCMNVGGDVWYAAMDANGSVNSYELRPSYNPTSGRWEAADEESDSAYDCESGEYPEGIDPAKCLFAIGEHVTADNWKELSIADDEYPVVELSRLLNLYGENKHMAGWREAEIHHKQNSIYDSSSAIAADNVKKEIFAFVEKIKQSKK